MALDSKVQPRLAPWRVLASAAVPAPFLQVLDRVDWCTVTAFGLPFVLYWLTLAPTVYNLDSAELTTAAATGGIMRATGYPLYLLLGRVWSWLPAGDVGYRLNLFSALCGALTIALAERIMRHLRVGPWARLGALGLLACAPYFWALSLIAEVYTLHTALMAGLILLLLRWAERPTPGRLALAVGLAALSMGHHGATVLLVPGCVWYVLTVAPHRATEPRALAAAGVGLLAGLSIFLYLPLLYGARPEFNYAGFYDSTATFIPKNLQTFDGVWWLVTGRSFAGQMFGYSGAELWSETLAFAEQLWAAFFTVGLGPGLVGLVISFRQDWRRAGMLLLMFVCSTAFYVNYRVPDKDTMFLPAYLIWGLWLGVGFQAILGGLPAPHSEQTPRTLRRIGWLARAGLLALVVCAMLWTWPRVDLSDDWSARQRGEMLLDGMQPNAIVLGDWETVAVIQYLQFVEGRRSDVLAINRFLISQEATVALIATQSRQRPIYINYLPNSLRRTFTVDPAGPLYLLRPRRPNPGPAGGP